jgi:hypothetical protein
LDGSFLFCPTPKGATGVWESFSDATAEPLWFGPKLDSTMGGKTASLSTLIADDTEGVELQ